MSDPSPSLELINIRRKMRRLALPLLLGMSTLVALLILTALMLPPHEVAFVANLTLLCACLLPMLIVLGLLYFGLMVGIFYMARAHRATHRQLNRVHAATRTATQRVAQTNENITRRATHVGARAARLDVLWDVFENTTQQKESDDGQRDQH